jgi:hypothetical protein
MFKSKIRPVVISQYEHGRLSGIFASLWGNASFDRPALDFAAFIEGVAFHDWHYGLADSLSIGEAPEDEWLETVTRGVELRFDDALTDLVAKHHIRRLISSQRAGAAALLEKIEARISERLPETGLTRTQFEWADRITRFCDHLAFDFSFEQPLTNTLPVYARQDSLDKTPVTYAIRPNGEIVVEPWPFAAESFSGILTAFQLDGYPQSLSPVLVPYCCVKGTSLA